MTAGATSRAAVRGAQVSTSVMLGLIFGAARHRCGLRVCSWCGRWLGLARELAEGAVTHGICEPCAQEFSGAGTNVCAPVSVGCQGGPSSSHPRRPETFEVIHDD